MLKRIRGAGLALIALMTFACNPPKVAETPKQAADAALQAVQKTSKGLQKLQAKVNNELELPAGPIARVNGVEINKAEFIEKYKKMTRTFTSRKKAVPENLSRRYQQSILNQLIDQELLDQKIKSEKIEVTEAELENEFVEYKKMFRTDQNFERYLRSSNGDIQQIKDNIKHNIAVTKLLEKTSDLKVTEEDIKKYYDENLNRYKIKEQIRASHVLIKVKDDANKNEANEKEALARAEAVYKEAIKPNIKFSDVAKKHSEGPTRSKGGDLSFFARGRMDPKFEEVAFAMKVNEISKPIRSKFGYHVIKVTDRKEGRVRPFDEVKDSISKLLENKQNRKAKAALLKDLRSAAKIDKLLPDLQTPDKSKNIIRHVKPAAADPSISKRTIPHIKTKHSLSVPPLKKEAPPSSPVKSVKPVKPARD
ncbi:peptidylprolyl isomerase [Myxococcota bacterium]|nr:peptidylprolyl isomerase [Myxococcota bacterium]MBU1899638.1 peptidylprolyl isomerase [Myxococcota bacterium]